MLIALITLVTTKTTYLRDKEPLSQIHIVFLANSKQVFCREKEKNGVKVLASREPSKMDNVSRAD
jgi:hypothetical protein